MAITARTQTYENYLNLNSSLRTGYRVLIVGHAYSTAPALITTNANTLRSVRTAADITVAFAGSTIDAQDPASVLPFALARAISPFSVSTANPLDRPEVFFVLADADNDASYETAINAAVSGEEWLWIVTLRDSAAVRGYVANAQAAREALLLETYHVLALSDPATGSADTDLDGYAVEAAALAVPSVPVWPYTAAWNDQTVSGQLLAAAVAGLLAMSPAQQVLRGSALEPGWSSSYSVGLYAAEIETRLALGPVGFMGLRYDNQQQALYIAAPHTNLLTPEDSVWVSVVSVRGYVRRRIIDAVSSITPRADGSADAAIYSAVNSVLSDIFSNSNVSDVGAMYTSYSITKVGPNTVDLTKYDIQVALVIPLSIFQSVTVVVNATIN